MTKGRFVRVSGIMLGSLVLIGLLGVVFLYNQALEDVRGKSKAKISAKEYMSLFFEDQAVLAHDPFFSRKSMGSRDAGPVFNSLFRWTADTQEHATSIEEWHKNNSSRTLSPLPFVMSEQVRAAKDDWPKLSGAIIDIDKLDFSWMKDLAGYDFLDLERNSPLQRIYADAPAYEASYPRPDLKELGSWVKLRLLRSEQVGDLDQASAEVIALARLLYSTDDLANALLSVRFLSDGTRWSKSLAESGRPVPNVWNAFPADLLTRAKRHLVAYSTLFDLFTPQDVSEKVYLGPDSVAGACIAAYSIRESQFHLRGLLPKFETASQRDLILSRLSQDCRPHHLDTLWTTPAQSSRAFGGQAPGVLDSLPWIREIKWLRIYSSTLVDPFGGYR